MLGNFIRANTEEKGFPDLSNTDLAIVGVKEDRNGSGNEGCALAPDYIRKHLYNLYQGAFDTRIADLGNVRAGDSVSDTYFAVKTIVAQLLEQNITPVILGGSQDMTYANYQPTKAWARSSTSYQPTPVLTLGSTRMKHCRTGITSAKS